MLRLATLNDIDELNSLIKKSVRALSREVYSEQEIESAIKYVFSIDKELILDGTYYLIEKDGHYAACGGWSKRRTLFGGDQFAQREMGYLNPQYDAAKIRAFFVHPDYARQGYGKSLLNHCEKMALLNGFSEVELMATLPGVKLYSACGYAVIREIKHLLPDGVILRFKQMKKSLNKPVEC